MARANRIPLCLHVRNVCASYAEPVTKTNKILLAVLVVLLLVLAAIGGTIAVRSGLFGSSDDIAQPYNETRYSGTIDQAEGLIDAADPVPVVLVVRFHDSGKTGELTSPTLKRHSTLTRTSDHTYREDIVHGEDVDAGDSGVEWTFEPGENDAMDVSYTTSGGATASAELPQTDPEETSGEVGINPEVAGAEPDGIEFSGYSARSTGPIELVHADDPSKNISDEVIFRISSDGETHTVTYPGRGCYGTIDSTDPNNRVENITVGDCESGGTWHFISGDMGGGTAEYTSADGKLTGSLDFRHSEWETIDGEIGIARSGPVLDFYRDFTGGDGDTATEAKGSCDPSEFADLIEKWEPETTTVVYCDGAWAVAGLTGSDFIGDFHFVDGKWEVLERDGRTSMTRHQCHNLDKLRDMGAPEEFIDELILCD